MKTLVTGFIAVIVTITINSLVLLFAIDNLADEVREANKANEQVIMAYEEEPVVAAYEEPEEEIVPVYYEKQEDGDMIYEFGYISDDSYFFIIINEEQGQYEYYCPAMSEDWPLAYNSLSELQESVICHIDQEWPNAAFAMTQK